MRRYGISLVIAACGVAGVFIWMTIRSGEPIHNPSADPVMRSNAPPIQPEPQRTDAAIQREQPASKGAANNDAAAKMKSSDDQPEKVGNGRGRVVGDDAPSLPSLTINETIVKDEHTPDIRDQYPPPFKVVKCLAYQRDERKYDLYFVGDTQIVRIIVDLPSDPGPSLIYDSRISTKDIQITLYSGPDIQMYVIPVGPAIPIPTNKKEYAASSIKYAVVVIDDPPKTIHQNPFKVSITEMDAGDGKISSIKPMDFNLTCYPP
jgi:hypothetical protein